MTANPLRVLCVHGVGNHHEDQTWQTDWQDRIRLEINRWSPNRTVNYHFPLYDEIFSKAEISFTGTLGAMWKLLGSGAGSLFRRRRGFFDDVQESIRWTAGMVVQWVEDDDLREETRQLLLEAISSFSPDVICAHSLGSLVCYDTFTSREGKNAFKDGTFISLGSQIGNPFVVGNFMAGRIVPLNVRKWYHLYNQHDNIFTARISLVADNFEQIETPFDDPGVENHSALSYFSHSNTVDRVWRELAAPDDFRALTASSRVFRELAKTPTRRALLVGINEYPDPAMRLEGCLNDVFLMSSVLQECGFEPDGIRTVLDNRSTAQGIRDRLEWLLGGIAPGDQRVFYYSGHGAQIPGYGASGEVDNVDECLVPYDFDWTPEKAIVDDWLYELYSQLPYECYFLMIVDCCHSGGLTRAGGRTARGIDPPDDIRHRMLKWDREHEMWVPRELKQVNKDFAADETVRRAFAGEAGVTRKLGRSADLRSLENEVYNHRRTELGHQGPYLPIIIQACQESEYAYEYRHGTIAYGAFTYCIAKILREHSKVRQIAISFKDLVEEAKADLEELGYAQTPALVGPKAIVESNVPWGAERTRRGRRR